MRLGINLFIILSMVLFIMNCAQTQSKIDEDTIREVTKMVLREVFERTEAKRRVKDYDVTLLLDTFETNGAWWQESVDYQYNGNYKTDIDSSFIQELIKSENDVTILGNFRGTVCTDSRCTWHLGIHEASKEAILYLNISSVYVYKEDVLHIYVDLGPFCVYTLFIIKKKNTEWRIDGEFKVVEC